MLPISILLGIWIHLSMYPSSWTIPYSAKSGDKLIAYSLPEWQRESFDLSQDHQINKIYISKEKILTVNFECQIQYLSYSYSYYIPIFLFFHLKNLAFADLLLYATEFQI